MMIYNFDSNYLWGGFSDKEHGFVVLNASKMADVREFLQWARDQPGLAAAEVDMLTELVYLPQTFKELLGAKRLEAEHSEQ